MRLGFTSMNTPEDVPPDVLARELEARGFDSLWIGEHPQIPVDRRTPYPAGGAMPDQYKRMMDPFQSLLLAARATTGLLVGTGVTLPLEHDIFALAKAVATLDHLSGGRLLFGVGVGWNEEELAASSEVPWPSRYEALGEAVAALRALWTEEESELHGRFYDFERVWSFPKPRQQPHPPVYSGTSGRVGTKHAVAWADGWMPVDAGLGDVAKQVGRFRAALEAAGRDPASVGITMVTFGDPDLATLARYRDLGVERAVVGANRTGWHDPATALPCIDACAAMIDELA